ncbi:MAG: endonuclease/exonuclease/phosphatase family protein [Chlamydiales bacterium]|nr:endonuclease/exonuclease/phosphatase family protein [Chlamydiales bacterium]
MATLTDTLVAHPSFKEWAAESAFKAASHLTTPLCKTRELYVRLKHQDALDPTENRVANWAKKCWLFVQLTTCGSVAVISTLPGIVLRALGNLISEYPYTYKCGEAREKRSAGNTFTMLSWNICCVPAGYSITDGGVAPWPERIRSVTEAIRKKDADVVCLYEIMDFNAGQRLFEELKEQYAHFYFNIGAQAVGPSSGIFVASKYPVTDPQFTRFPIESLVGRTKHAAKGVFSFDIPNARIFATHTQHSEEPAHPTEDEKAGRASQMELIAQQMQQVEGKATILTGDLNLDKEEYEASQWKDHFEGVVHFEKPKTWGGDGFCARLEGKPVSPPRNLDYTVYLKGSVAAIQTNQLQTGYDQNAFKIEALSDHNGLFSTVQLR